MKIEIAYCITCNYRPIAASLAFLIEKEISVKPTLVPSNTSGAYEVLVDGEKIFSKISTGRFPDNNEIVAVLKKVK